MVLKKAQRDVSMEYENSTIPFYTIQIIQKGCNIPYGINIHKRVTSFPLFRHPFKS